MKKNTFCNPETILEYVIALLGLFSKFHDSKVSFSPYESGIVISSILEHTCPVEHHFFDGIIVFWNVRRLRLNSQMIMESQAMTYDVQWNLKADDLISIQIVDNFFCLHTWSKMAVK